MNTPHIPLTPAEQTRLTVALELENAGFHESANWLREQIATLRGIKWHEVAEKNEKKPLDSAGWERLFRIHRGSLPPQSPSQISHLNPLPQSITPTIREDQTRGES